MVKWLFICVDISEKMPNRSMFFWYNERTTSYIYSCIYTFDISCLAKLHGYCVTRICSTVDQYLPLVEELEGAVDFILNIRFHILTAHGLIGYLPGCINQLNAWTAMNNFSSFIKLKVIIEFSYLFIY